MSENIYIYPTDTIWGIGGSVMEAAVYQRVMEIKQCQAPRPVSILFTNRDELEESFKLPRVAMVDDFWEQEITLLLPKQSQKKKYSDYLFQGSDWVGVRYLKQLQPLRQIVGAPIITTSLNLAGKKEIVDKSEAYKFHQQYAPGAIFYSKIQMNPSGMASSIVKYEGPGKYQFVRKGRYFEDIRDRLQST